MTKEETLFEETEWAMGDYNGYKAWGNVAAIHVYDFERHFTHHRISVERFKELAKFTYDHDNPDLISSGEEAQVVWITIFMKDGRCYERKCVDNEYRCEEKWVCRKIDSGRIVPDELPIEDDFVKRLWTDNYEDRHCIPHDESDELYEKNPRAR